MRKILMALGAAALLAGPALADDETTMAAPAAEQIVHVDRYAFNTRGTTGEEAAAGRCGAETAAVRTRHTMRDVAAAVFTAGWYTPEHVIIDCPAAATPTP